MNILAFDTCYDACSAAAGRKLRSLTPSIAFAFEPMATGQAERLMPMIESVMADAGMGFNELDRIVIATGPGTFTGARIAVSAARALALATGAAVVTVSSLELMAMNPDVAASGAATIAIATDARRGEVYFQQFDAHTLFPLDIPRAYRVAEAVEVLRPGSAVIAGSGAAALAGAAAGVGRHVNAILPGLVPDAIDVLFAAYGMAIDMTVAPLYLRPPDAKPPQPGQFTGNAA